MSLSDELEAELAAQLQEQQEALESVVAALQMQHSADMEEMRVALEEGISDTQSALMELKRSRLLRMLQGGREAEPQSGEAPAPVPEAQQGLYAPGLTCLFRHTDGRWHDGIIRSCTSTTASLDFLRPTRPHHLALAQVPVDLIKPSERDGRADGSKIDVGSSVLAKVPYGGGLWSRAEVIAVDSRAGRVSLVFMTDEGSTDAADVPIEEVALQLRGAARSLGSLGGREEEDEDDDGEDGDSDADAEDMEDEVAHLGIGRAAAAMATSYDAVEAAAAAGPQTDVAHFADWEGHTRGIASKIMAAMGYVNGKGLGRDGAGRALPLEVRLLRPGMGLGADEGRVAEGHGKRRKRKRGGARAREKRHADRARADREARRQGELEKEKATGTSGVFSFINSALGDKSEAAAVVSAGLVVAGSCGAANFWGSSCNENASQAPQSVGGSSTGGKGVCAETLSRKSLMDSQDKILQIRNKLGKLGEMRQRNIHDKVIRVQVDRKIAEVQAELAAAEGDQRQAETQAKDKQKMKKWMKF